MKSQLATLILSIMLTFSAYAAEIDQQAHAEKDSDGLQGGMMNQMMEHYTQGGGNQ
jgi:hypothetical protein